jgi:hypothetical protein
MCMCKTVGRKIAEIRGSFPFPNPPPPLPDRVNVAGLEKTRVFLKKTSPVGFLGFFGFFGFFCPDERVFRVFSSFMNTFRCIQTLNYNHSY